LVKIKSYQHGGFLRGPPILRRAKRNGGSENQSRRFHRRVKGLLYDGFFLLPSCGRMLFNIQFNVSSKVLTRNADIISTIRTDSVDIPSLKSFCIEQIRQNET